MTHQDTSIMRSQVITNALSLGYDDTLEDKARMTYGRYIKWAENLLEQGLISDGKFDELLIEAFRTDLIYGLDDGGELID